MNGTRADATHDRMIGGPKWILVWLASAAAVTFGCSDSTTGGGGATGGGGVTGGSGGSGGSTAGTSSGGMSGNAGTGAGGPGGVGGVSAGGTAGASSGGSGAATGGAAGMGAAGGSGGGAAGMAGSGGFAGVGGSTGVGVPLPPDGSVLCGSGEFTGAEAQAACQVPPSLGSLHPSYPPLCSLLQTEGGRWEAWCEGSRPIYVWVKFDQVSVSDCRMVPDILFSHTEYRFGNGGLSTSPNEAPPYNSGSIRIDASPDDMGVHMRVSNADGASGTGHLWLAAQGDCGNMATDTKGTVIGVAFDWSG